MHYKFFIFAVVTFLFSVSDSADAGIIKCSLLIKEKPHEKVQVRYKLHPSQDIIRYAPETDGTLVLKPKNGKIEATLHSGSQIDPKKLNGWHYARLRLLPSEDGLSGVLVAQQDPRQVEQFIVDPNAPYKTKLPCAHADDLWRAQQKLTDAIKNAYRFDATIPTQTFGISVETLQEFNSRSNTINKEDKYERQGVASLIYEQVVVPDMLTTREQFDAVSAIGSLRPESQGDLLEKTVQQLLPGAQWIRPHLDTKLQLAYENYVQVLTGKVDTDSELQTFLWRSIEQSNVKFVVEVFKPVQAGSTVGVTTAFSITGQYFMPNFFDGISLRGSGQLNDSLQNIRQLIQDRDEKIRIAFGME